MARRSMVEFGKKLREQIVAAEAEVPDGGQPHS